MTEDIVTYDVGPYALLAQTSFAGQLVAPDLELASARITVSPWGSCHVRAELGAGVSPAQELVDPSHRGMSVRGVLEDGRKLLVREVIPSHVSMHSSGETILALEAVGRVELSAHAATTEPATAEIGIMNCKFDQRASRRGFKALGREWSLEPVDDHRQRERCLRVRLCRALCTGHLTTAVCENVDTEALWQQAHDLCSLLSICCATSVTPVYLRLLDVDRRELAMTVEARAAPSRYQSFHQFVGGSSGVMPGFLETTADTYVAVKDGYGLAVFSELLLFSMSQPEVELKLAGMIMALEHLCTMYGMVELGWSTADVRGKSITSKLRAVNTKLRLIPSHLLNDRVTQDVRNPLFHRGVTDLNSAEDSYALYCDFVEVALAVLFTVLGYDSPRVARLRAGETGRASSAVAAQQSSIGGAA